MSNIEYYDIQYADGRTIIYTFLEWRALENLSKLGTCYMKSQGDYAWAQISLLRMQGTSHA